MLFADNIVLIDQTNGSLLFLKGRTILVENF